MSILRVGTGGAQANQISIIAAFTYTIPAYTVGNHLVIFISQGDNGATNNAPTVVDNLASAWTVKSTLAGLTPLFDNVHVAYRENVPSGITSVTVA